MPTRRLISLAALSLLALAGCNTTRLTASDPNIGKGPEAPVGSFWKYKLPLTPGITLAGNQGVAAKFGEQKAAFDAALEVKPDSMLLVVTLAGGPRLVTVTWDKNGLKEERSVLAPEAIRGVNLVSDIFMSLWPIATVKASMPADIRVEETAKLRRFTDQGGKMLIEIETLEKSGKHLVQEVRSPEFGYVLKVTTEFDQ